MWFVVQTKPKKEKAVKSNLERDNFEAFLPMLCERRYQGREFIKPLFPGYLFVFSSWRGLRKVMWTSGVKKVLGYGDSPTPVEDEIVFSIREKVDSVGIIYSDKKFKCGDRVSVVDGPFSGRIGTIEEIKSSKERIRILLSLFEVGVRLEVDMELAEKLA
jgi:transcription antitermination factor NusG